LTRVYLPPRSGRSAAGIRGRISRAYAAVRIGATGKDLAFSATHRDLALQSWSFMIRRLLPFWMIILRKSGLSPWAWMGWG